MRTPLESAVRRFRSGLTRILACFIFIVAGGPQVSAVVTVEETTVTEFDAPPKPEKPLPTLPGTSDPTEAVNDQRAALPARTLGGGTAGVLLMIGAGSLLLLGAAFAIPSIFSSEKSTRKRKSKPRGAPSAY